MLWKVHGFVQACMFFHVLPLLMIRTLTRSLSLWEFRAYFSYNYDYYHTVNVRCVCFGESGLELRVCEEGLHIVPEAYLLFNIQLLIIYVNCIPAYQPTHSICKGRNFQCPNISKETIHWLTDAKSTRNCLRITDRLKYLTLVNDERKGIFWAHPTLDERWI